MAREIWKDVVGFEGKYQVSNLGRVKSLPRKHQRQTLILKQNPHHQGYMLIGLCRHALKRKNFFVHLLVADAFGLRTPKKKHFEINHKNGCKSDNRLTNLEYIHRRDNKKHASETGLMPYGERLSYVKNKDDVIQKIKKVLDSGETSPMTISKKLKIKPQLVSDVKRGRYHRHFTSLAAMIVFVISSCSTIPPFDGTPKPKPDEGEIKTALPNQEWSNYLYKLVQETNLGELDIPYEDTYCPQTLTDENFTQLLVAVMYHESSFNPNATYTEKNIYDRHGNRVVSSGLFQISLESGNHYCPWIKKQEDLFDAYLNMRCGVELFRYFINKDMRVGFGSGKNSLGAARYFAVMRDHLRPKVKAYLKPWCQ